MKNFIQVIKTRRSIRKFSKDSVPKEIIEDIIDCARLAPSARNIQPWEFIVVTDKKMLNKLAEITKGFGDFIAECAFCIVVFCKDTKYYLEDGSAATQNILLAAHSLNLGACWVAGDKKPYADEVRRVLNVPDGYKLVSLVPVGYPAEKPAPIRKRKLNEVVHWEKF